MTYDDPLILHSLHQAAAVIYAETERTPEARRRSVIEAAELLRLCQEHLEGAAPFQLDDDRGFVWPDEDDDTTGHDCHDPNCQSPHCRLPW